MSPRSIALLVGPVILTMLVALMSIPLGYGPVVGPRAVAVGLAWVALHTLVSWLWQRWRRRGE